MVRDFTGGIYVAGDTTRDVPAIEGGYWIQNSPVEVGGALSRIDTDGYVEAWDNATLALNLHLEKRFRSKLQISHSWTSSRSGVPGEDFQETRIQLQYVW